MLWFKQVMWCVGVIGKVLGGVEQHTEPGKMTKEVWMRRDLGLARSVSPCTNRHQEQSNLMVS